MKLKLTIGIICGMLLTSINADTLTAQGSDFGTNRQPRTCPSRSAPTKGRISAEQASIYAACRIESLSKSYRMWFVDILSLEVAKKPRPVNASDLTKFYQADPSQPAYDLRGSMVMYSCYKNGRIYPEGRNCIINRSPQASGTCLKNTFGEWFCSLGGSIPTGSPEWGPPPN